MYIRRKVFSAVEDENGEIRYFSTNEIVSEEEYLEALYSEDFLDDDDMERLYSSKEDGMSTAAKVGIGAGAATAALTAAHFGGKAAAKKIARGFEANAVERGLAKMNAAEKKAWEKTGGKLANKVTAKVAKHNISKLDLSELKTVKAVEDYLKAGSITEAQAKARIKEIEAAAKKEAKEVEKAAAANRKLVAKNKAALEKGGWRKRTGFRG